MDQLNDRQQALLERLRAARGQTLCSGHFDSRTADALVRRGLARYEYDQRSEIGSALFGRDGSAQYFTAKTLVLAETAPKVVKNWTCRQCRKRNVAANVRCWGCAAKRHDMTDEEIAEFCARMQRAHDGVKE